MAIILSQFLLGKERERCFMWYYVYPSLDGVENLPFYIISIGLYELQLCIKRPQGYEYDQFFFNSSGSGRLEMAGKNMSL